MVRRLLALVAVALALGACGGSDDQSPKQTARAEGTFRGIAQDGAALGSAKAPYTMLEFIDLQCPFCARYDREILPAVVERFVRRGTLRLELRPIAVLGPDSGPAAAAAVAASLQDRMWHFTDVFYRHQGRENSGYVTRAYLDGIAGAVPGLDPARLRRDSAGAKVRGIIANNARVANTARVTATPNFRLGKTGGVLTPFHGRALDREDFLRRLAAAIGV